MNAVAISLGGNQVDSGRLLQSALASLSQTLDKLTISSLFRTPAVSDIPQRDFLNAAAIGVTYLGPEDLLALLKASEQLHGRRRGERWGPRLIDIDLLVYGDLVSERPELWLPHPRLRERRFYLEPLAEIAPDLQIPPDGATVRELLQALPAGESFERIPWEDRGREELRS